MKRKPLVLAIALLLVVGAALWGINYRLDHPPLTKADKEFRALVSGADKVEITRMKTQSFGAKGRLDHMELEQLNVSQTRELVEKLRFVDMDENTSVSTSPMRTRKTRFIFFHREHKLIEVSLESEEGNNFICAHANYNPSGKNFPLNYKLNPRANKSLNRALDAYLPQRIRP